MKVIISPRALNDLADIAEFIARDDPDRARSFIRELRDACRSLGIFPRRYPAVAAFGRNARRCNYGNYVIIYDVTDVVEVVTIVHAARDLDSLP